MGEKNDNSSNNNNRKPYLYYYCIVLLIVMVLNALVFPSVMERSVEVPFNGSNHRQIEIVCKVF